MYGYDHSPMLLAFVWAESEFDLGLRQFHYDGLRRLWKKRMRRREMGKLTIIVLATLAASGEIGQICITSGLRERRVE